MATQSALLKELVAANKSSPVSQPMSSTDWTPLISGIAALLSVTPIIMVRYLGLEPSILQHSTPSTPQPTTDSTITTRLDVLEGQYNNLPFSTN